MTQKQHVMHGRDHATGGADPIPGLNGGGGGALEWEDTGTGITAPTMSYSGYGQNIGQSIAAGAAETALPMTPRSDSMLEVTATNPTWAKLKLPGVYYVSAWVWGWDFLAGANAHVGLQPHNHSLAQSAPAVNVGSGFFQASANLSDFFTCSQADIDSSPGVRIFVKVQHDDTTAALFKANVGVLRLITTPATQAGP